MHSQLKERGIISAQAILVTYSMMSHTLKVPVLPCYL